MSISSTRPPSRTRRASSTSDGSGSTKTGSKITGRPDRLRVKVLDRAVSILEALAANGPDVGVVELARLTELSKGTVHRLLSALEDHRLVEQDAGSKRYRLGFKLFELGTTAGHGIDLGRRAEPFLEELVNETGDTGNLAVLDGGMVLYVAKVEGWHSLRMPSQVGKRLEAHCTALGKTLLAFAPDAVVDRIIAGRRLRRHTLNTLVKPSFLKAELARIRKQGYGVDDEELEIGLRCVAAPVRDHTGDVVAAISISGPTGRITKPAVAALASKVVAAADAISMAMGAPK